MSSSAKIGEPAFGIKQSPGELSDEDLDGVSGGLSILGKLSDADDASPESLGAVGGGFESPDETNQPDQYEGSMESVARHAPEFENTGKTEILLGVVTQDGTTKALAGFTAGDTEISDAGNGVTMTAKYTVAAIAQAYYTQTSAGAGAMAGTGASVGFDLGRGVTFEASGEAAAKAGVGAGVVGNNLVVEGGVSAEASATAEISAQSEALDDAGTTARGETSVSAGVQAVAGAEGSIGANGISGDYGAGVGFYAKAEGEAEVGNDAAALTVGGGVITPGSVSAGISGGAVIEDGKLTLSFGSEFAFVIGGVSISFSLDIQLFDGTKTVGSAEEISAKEREIFDRVSVYDTAITETWRGSLREDAAAADREVGHAAGLVSQALAAVNGYDAGVRDAVADFAETRARIDEGRETFATVSDPVKRAEALTMLDRDEADLNKRIALWEEKMSSPAETEKRETLFADLKEAQSKLDVMQGFAAGVHERLKVAESMTFMQFRTTLETMEKVAEDRLNEAREIEAAEKRGAAEVIERVEENRKAVLSDQSGDLNQRQALHDDWAGKVTQESIERVENASRGVADAQQKLAAFHEYKEKYEPEKSAWTTQEYTKNLAGDLQKRYDNLPDSASDADRRAVQGALEGAKLAERLAGDNVGRFKEHMNSHHDHVILMNKELDVLRTEVKVPGLFDEIARAFD